MQITVNQLAERHNVDKQIAYGFLKFLEAEKLAVATGTLRVEGAKGKGATLYEVAETITINLQSALAPE